WDSWERQPLPSEQARRQSPGDYSERRRSRRSKARDRRRSGLYLPAWSVVAMLMIVFLIAFGIVLLIGSLGGQAAPGGDPRVLIVTAEASNTPAGAAAPPTTVPAALQPVESAAPLPGFDGPVPTFALEGPTLAPVVLSPTPLSVVQGANVIVVDVGDIGLNIRANPGLAADILLSAPENMPFVVIGGPQQVDNLTWWQVQDSFDAAVQGWAAADYLQAVAPSS
ncbi:MAG: SH3 domain-containing protein, partial [Chloroflexi bacterium]|nr:SH3 domain-containing protein [Chloroflexota bacterium]